MNVYNQPICHHGDEPPAQVSSSHMSLYSGRQNNSRSVQLPPTHTRRLTHEAIRHLRNPPTRSSRALISKLQMWCETSFHTSPCTAMCFLFWSPTTTTTTIFSHLCWLPISERGPAWPYISLMCLLGLQSVASGAVSCSCVGRWGGGVVEGGRCHSELTADTSVWWVAAAVSRSSLITAKTFTLLVNGERRKLLILRLKP